MHRVYSTSWEFAKWKSLENLKLEKPKKSEGNDQSKSSQEGFFCSELVAAAYKAAGLLDPIIASSRYFPGKV